VAVLTVTCPAITVAPATLPGGTVGVGYSQALTASGGAGSYTFTLTSGSLPAGLGLTNGVISGTPTTAGTNTLTVAAADTNGCTGSRSYALGVRAAVSEGIFNVRVSQRAGTNLVDLYYDLFTTTSNPLVVTVAVSTNGGNAYDLPATHFSGDAGSGVTPGTNKWVVWDAGQDWPERFSTNVFFRLTVSDVTPVAPEMVLIPGGSFTMGDTLDGDSEANPTNVYVSAFYMDANLVTWSQWQGVYAYATNHGYGFAFRGAGKGLNHPVQTVDWYDCVKWCNARSQQAGKVPVYYTDAGLTEVYTNGEVEVYVDWGAKGYRLPTEAEWEKAARGGLSGQRFPWGNLISLTNANYQGNTNTSSYDLGPDGYSPIGTVGGWPYTSPVGSFAANGFGLYDMAGNVLQWCWDWYGTPYAGGTDPRGAASGSCRVLRGGSWGSHGRDCPTACRYGIIPPWYKNYGIGFRSVLPSGQ
jgi:formylglycine-generating enzyme required for sulfatase activity